MQKKKLIISIAVYRSSRPGVFCKKGVLRNFSKFTGKHLCRSPFFNEVAGLRPAILLKKSLRHRCFPVNFAKLLRTHFLKEHSWWLLLGILSGNMLDVGKTGNKNFVEKLGINNFFNIKRVEWLSKIVAIEEDRQKWKLNLSAR